MRYELYYWDGIQGRGEFVRLALEDAGARYVDVARGDGGEDAMLALLDGRRVARPPFAPPFLKSGKQLIGQTANILLYLGPRLGLAPASESGRLWTHQLQLTLADLVAEAHDVHHPIAGSLYYEDQRREAKRRAKHFVAERIPKFLDYFERVLAHNPRGAPYLLGRAATYADLSLFQVRGGPWLRVSQGDGAACTRSSQGDRRARSRARAARRRGVPRLAAPHSVQRAGHLPPLPGARPLTVKPIVEPCAPTAASISAARTARAR